MPAVDSSAIRAVEYDAATERLAVGFVSGAAYIYAGVTAETYAALLAAPSKGAFFVEHIRDAHPFERVD